MIPKVIKEPSSFTYNGNKFACEFPIYIFPKQIQKLITDLKNVSQFETQITSSTLLFVVSTIIGNRCKIKVKETWIDTCNVWISIVGKPGTMKTPSMSFMLTPLKKAETEYNERFIADLKNYNSIPKKEREEHFKPRRQQRYSNDPTVEGLINAMIYNTNGMGIYKDELNGFFEEMNRYNSGGNKEFYMSAFSGGQYIKNRASYDPITIDNIFLSIIGSIQPELLKELSNVNISNGMVDRWLFVESDNTIPMFKDDDIPQDLITMYHSFIDAIEFWLPPENLIWTQEAKEYFYNSINCIGEVIKSDETSEKLSTYLAKMRTYYARFIIIICALYQNENITLNIVKAAESLTEFFTLTAKNTFIGFNNSTEINIIFEREKSVTDTEKIKSLLINLPEMSKTEIAKVVKCSRQMVYKVDKQININ